MQKEHANGDQLRVFGMFFGPISSIDPLSKTFVFLTTHLEQVISELCEAFQLVRSTTLTLHKNLTEKRLSVVISKSMGFQSYSITA